MPERAHEAARQAAGIPDHISLGREPLDETEEEWLRSCGKVRLLHNSAICSELTASRASYSPESLARW
jgi:hypothetical protein